MTNADRLYTMYRDTLSEVDRVAGGGLLDGTALPDDALMLDPIARRMLVKAIFALMEAVAHTLKSEAVLDFPDALSAAEQALCSDQEYRLTDGGEVQLRSARIPTIANIRFAFAISAKASGARFTLEVAADGWQRLLRAIKVRDRLTHPKLPSDLVVRDSEVTDATLALAWFQQQLFVLLDQTNQVLRERTAAIKAEQALAASRPPVHNS